MITREQAIDAREFHAGVCIRRIGKRGGVTLQQETWRRNGTTKLWKTRPEDFSIPIKHGLYAHAYLDHGNAPHFHLATECNPREIHA